MKNRILKSALIFIYLLYGVAVFINNDTMGDILSPVLMLIISYTILYGFVIQQKTTIYKWFGCMLTLSAFFWFLCDFWWGIQTLLLHSNPEDNFITVYGYFLTNLFLLLSILFATYRDLKKMNKIQAMLDTLIVSISLGVLLWLFVFNQNNDRVLLLLSEPISMASIIIDVIIFAWINVWLFSTRLAKPPIHHLILAAGGLAFVITDFAYFYIDFYSTYNPNSWVDGAYMTAFCLTAISAFFRAKENPNRVNQQSAKCSVCKFSVEFFIWLAPIVVFVFKRNQIQYFVLLVLALLIYYVLITYTQKSIFQEKLLELEKKNVSELEKKVEERTKEITKILNTDFVTGLYSRRYFEAKLSKTIKNLGKNELVSLLYIDQNKSKAIKILYGKEIAERLLKEIAEYLHMLVSENHGIIAAYGDDIFVIMIKAYEADAIAERIATQIIERCNELFSVEDHLIRVTLNVGISCYPRDTLDGNNLIKNADIAMMQARTKGFNQVQTYSDKIGSLSFNRHSIELKLKKAVFDLEFQLYYQPQVFCKDGSLCGLEALSRWFEGGKNFISPLDFIPIAEETGMIVPLGHWVIENAARQYSIWKAETGQEYKIAVNVSSKQLVEIDFVQKLEDVLKVYNVKPELFEVEITESQQIENSINIQETLLEIKKLGVSIAIDDFGTGYSSLNYIKNIPADRIKIAKELIDNIESDLYSNAIIQALISVAKVKGIQVIAEGVETKEQWEYLERLGCDGIQGYYFAKPLPVNELANTWVKREMHF